MCAGARDSPGPTQKSAWDGLTEASKSRHGPGSGAPSLYGKQAGIKESQTAGTDRGKGHSVNSRARAGAPARQTLRLRTPVGTQPGGASPVLSWGNSRAYHILLHSLILS